MNEKRITVEDAKAAYESTKAKPVIQVYCTKNADGNLCCCAIGAIFLAQGSPLEADAGDWANMVYGEAYVANFCAGFDGDTDCGCDEEDVEAFEDGVAVAEAIRPN